MIEQSADIGMMQSFRSRGVAIRGCDFRIGHESLHESLEVWIAKRSDEAGKSSPELVDILRGLGKIVGEVDFGFAQLAQLVDRELVAVLILVDQALDLEEI